MFLIFRNQPTAVLTWTPEEKQHARARRLNPGDRIFCGDGANRRFEGAVTTTGAVLNLELFEERIEARRILLCAVPESSRRDWLLQKCTELGMTDLVPIRFERSERNDFGKRADRIVLEAAAQSRRFRLPLIHPSLELAAGIRWAVEQGLHPIVLDPTGSERLLQSAGKQASESSGKVSAASFSAESQRDLDDALCFVIGPEGGISKTETEMLRDCVFRNLGRNILRIETAAVAALAMSLT